MGRLINGRRVISEPVPVHAGKLLIFCEGSTEYDYMDYFRKYLKNNLRVKYTDIVLEPINAKGNARQVFQYAENFLIDDNNARKYALYEKHLIFDCDAPEDIQNVITAMELSSNEYRIDYSCLLFETWLVMHFKELDVESDIKKAQIYKTMADFLRLDYYRSAEKASPGTIGALLGNGGHERIRAAILNAKKLEKFWSASGKNYKHDIKEMNPSTGIYSLVESLLDEIVYLCN